MNSLGYTHIFLSRQTQRGLSLIELMISITIGLLILSAMATLFVNQSRTRSELDKSNRMIDNGRYVLEVLSENLRLAGFYGERDIAPTGAINNPCTATPATPVLADMRAALGLHVAGYNAATASSAITGPPCGLTAAELKAGSDILVLRRADTNAILQGNAVNGIHYIQVSNCQFENATPFILDNVAANLILSQRGCTSANTAPFADVRRLVVQTYFVSPNNNGNDGIPTLKRMELDPAGSGAFVTTPLVEGIEYLQVDYGVDGDSNGDGVVDLAVFDGVADSYVAVCPDVACWSNVVSVRLNILARNIEPTTGYTDTKTYSLGPLAGNVGPFNAAPYNAAPNPTTYPKLENYKRHVYTQVVRLVNPSSRRESP